MKTGLLKSDIDRAEIQNIVFVTTMSVIRTKMVLMKKRMKMMMLTLLFVVVVDADYDVGDADDDNKNADIDVGNEDPIALLLCWVKVAFDRFGISISPPFLTIISPIIIICIIVPLHQHNHHIITNGN